MKPVSRYLPPGLVPLAIAAALILAVPTAWRVKLFLGLLLGLAALFRMLARWSEGYPARRRAFFIGVLFAPVVLLGAEATLAYLDWKQAQLAKPLRLTTEYDHSGLLTRSDLCSFGSGHPVSTTYGMARSEWIPTGFAVHPT